MTGSMKYILPILKYYQSTHAIRKNFPETISIAGFETSKLSGKIVTVNEVSFIDDGAGKKFKRVKKIAELKVQEIQGEVTLCKVKDGADILDEKMKSKAKMEFVIK